MRSIVKPAVTAMLISVLSSCGGGTVYLEDYMSGTEAGEDAMPAIRRALSDCRKMKADTLVLPEGELRILPDMAYEEYQFISNNTESLKRIAFDLDGMEDFTVKGNGTRLIKRAVCGLHADIPFGRYHIRDRQGLDGYPVPA